MSDSTRRQDQTMTHGKQCKVRVTATSDPQEPQGVKFDFTSAKKNSRGRLEFDKKVDNMPKADFYQVEFDLDDQTGMDLRFPSNAKDAMWTSDGSQNGVPSCPESAHHNDEFRATGVLGNGKKLTVRNEDSKVENIAFTLRFLPDGKYASDPKNYIHYDPVVENRNGGSSV
jgi:hypothetical protein